MERTGNGILFDEEPLGPDGSRFTLYPNRWEQRFWKVRYAKKWLEKNRKAVEVIVKWIK